MASARNLPPGNPNNSTPDPRVIWENGTDAIIEAGDYPPGLPRSRTCDTPGDAVAADVDPALITPPGPKSVAGRKLIKVPLRGLLAAPLPPPPGMPKAKDYQPAPPSPFLPKPWKGKVPEFPHLCRVCGGRYYQGLAKTIHEATESTPLFGACPGPTAKKRIA